MLEKIFNLFFIKEQPKKTTPLTIKRSQREIKTVEQNKTTRKEVSTCLSGYFKNHRGLNLRERGHVYTA